MLPAFYLFVLYVGTFYKASNTQKIIYKYIVVSYYKFSFLWIMYENLTNIYHFSFLLPVDLYSVNFYI